MSEFDWLPEVTNEPITSWPTTIEPLIFKSDPKARAAWESEIKPVLFKAVGIDSPMDSYSLLLEDLGRCFKCERCCRKADRNKLYSWKQLVTHFVDEYEQISWQESPEIIGWGNKLPAFYKTHDVHAPGSPIMILVTIPGMKFPLEY